MCSPVVACSSAQQYLLDFPCKWHPSIPAGAHLKGMAGDLLQQPYKLARTSTHCPMQGNKLVLTGFFNLLSVVSLTCSAEVVQLAPS